MRKIIAICMVVAFSLTGCGQDTINLSEIISQQDISCTISELVYEENRDYYFVAAEADDGSICRFRTNKEYWNGCSVEDELVITEKVINYPLSGEKVEYYIGDEKLYGVNVKLSEPEITISPDVGQAELLSETYVSCIINDIYEHKQRRYVGVPGKGGHMITERDYMITAIAEDGSTCSFETTYEYWESHTIGDNISILEQTANYPIGSVQTRYFLDGIRLLNLTITKTK